MNQLTFAEAEYQNKKGKTRREIFLEKVETIIPWKRLRNRATKHYSKGETGFPLPAHYDAACALFAVALQA
ncbi:MAG TPA: hypothetical protein VJY83_07555 [Thiopseudomonas sp.]|uniref:Transposase DDE domain-containing protein n=1 Tax=Denitrificimonas halotolerans TaxID=3098930 RepID=A0ABU5GQ76_9GAMM|nr:hypothetical protein [Denitrificimonas sp. JX-1]MDY7218505.1 hypothetical protein [Denitrificimonas sp. JX-1]HKM37474.1 hypothetical protein [Thiopseudomonas sp.]